MAKPRAVAQCRGRRPDIRAQALLFSVPRSPSLPARPHLSVHPRLSPCSPYSLWFKSRFPASHGRFRHPARPHKPSAGPQGMAAGHRLPAAGHPQRAADHPLPAAGHPQRAADHPLPAAGHPLPAADHPLRAADRPLKAASAPERPASGTITGRAVSRRMALPTPIDRTARSAPCCNERCCDDPTTCRLSTKPKTHPIVQ